MKINGIQRVSMESVKIHKNEFMEINEKHGILWQINENQQTHMKIDIIKLKSMKINRILYKSMKFYEEMMNSYENRWNQWTSMV